MAHAEAETTRRKLAQVRARIKAMPDDQKVLAERYGHDQQAALTLLPALDSVTRIRIGPAVREASLLAHKVRHQYAALESLLRDHGWLRKSAGALRFGGLLFLLGIILFQPIKKLGTDNPASTIAMYTGGGVCLLFLPLHRRMSRLNFRSSPIFSAASLLSIGLAASTADDYWRRHTSNNPSTHNTPQKVHQFDWSEANWHDVATGSTAMLTSFAVLLLIFEISLPLRRVTIELEDSKAIACAVVIDSLLEIALLLEAATRPKPPALTFIFSGEEIPPAFQPYIASDQRAKVVEKLESLARYLEGPWERRLRPKDPAGGAEIRRVADGIAASVRSWKPTAAIGGEKLGEMRDAFSEGLVDAVNGRWLELTREISAREALGKRVLRSVRRAAAISVFSSAVLLVFLQPFSWTHSLANPAAALPLMLCATVLAGFLDPTIFERAGAAVKLSNDVLSKR
ncbi:hypothetical protein [Kitasatospora sp. NPDC001095]